MDRAVIRVREALQQVPYLARIQTQDDYDQALALMDELIDNYDANELLIEILAGAIARWEETSPEFAEFNAELTKMGLK